MRNTAWQTARLSRFAILVELRLAAARSVLARTR
jgi:hypothetical protein